MSDLVKVEEAAKALGFSKPYLYKSAAAGAIPCHRAGRAIRFDVDEVRGGQGKYGRGTKMIAAEM